MNSKISIIIPCYNHAHYLDEALESVFNQTYSFWECIIVNDGSKDNTEEVTNKWINKDQRFSYVYQDNSGLSSARNKGINLASGEFILPLDADDKIANTYLSSAVHILDKDKDVKVVYCKAKKFGKTIEDWELPFFSLYNLSRNNMIFCSAFFRKKDWEKVGGFDVNMIYGWEDWEFWIALLKNGGKVVRLNQVGFYYRISTNSMLNKIDNEKGNYLLRYLNVKHADFFVKYFDTFHSLERTIKENENKYKNKLKSKKYILNLFCNTFLGFTLFGKYEKES